MTIQQTKTSELTLLIRDFDETRDFPAVVQITNRAWPDRPGTVEEWEDWWNRRNTSYFFHRDVIEVNGQMVAWGDVSESEWEYVPGKYNLNINVDPDWRGRGIATRWYQHALENVLAKRDLKPILLAVGTREDQPEARSMLAKLGFEQKKRYPRSLLDVAAFDPAPLAWAFDKIQQHGIVLKRLSDLQQSDPDWQRKLYDMDSEVAKDIPSPEEITPPSFEDYIKEALSGINFEPRAWFVALDGEQYVGLTQLWTDQALPTKLYTGLTGVKRSHRRKGIATALKVRSIEEFAKPYGATEVETDNEENNPMYQINLRLGYQPAPAYLDFRKTLDAAE